jgi:hypothetical protein
MGAAEITTEARLAAIMASLRESRTLLASSARLVVNEGEGQVATTASFAVTATPLLVPDRLREQLESKSSSTSLTSTHLAVVDGVLHTDVVLAPFTPTRCSALCSEVHVGNNLDAVVFPTSGTTHIPSTTLTVAGNGILQGAGVSGTGCSSHVLTSPREGLVDGARAVNTYHTRDNSFPRFDGTDPGLWRAQCLEYFDRFNINKCMWVIAATMHMDGKAKEWFEAYRLRQVVGDWPEFIDDVEAHFVVGALSPSTTILGDDHPCGVVHGTVDISPETPTRCSPVSPKEVTTTDAKPMKPTPFNL